MKKRILVIRFGSFGDIILTSAALANLRISYRGHSIVFLTKARFRPVVERFGSVDEIVTLPDSATMGDYYRLLLQLDDGSIDMVVDLHGNPRSWLARRLIGANRKVVYPKRRRERYRITRRRKRIPDSWPHTIDLYNDAIAQLGTQVHCRRPVLPLLPATDGLKGLDALDKSQPLVAFAPGAAHPNKQWPMDKFAEVALQLNSTHNVAVLWLVTDADRGQSGLEDKLPPGSFVELVNYPIEQLADLIATARVTIANDSGIAHLSSAVGTPVVAVFGPTHPALGFAPRGLFDTVVEVDEACRPCSLHGRTPCYRNRRYCFDRVTSEMVGEVAAEQLELQAGVERALFVDRDGTLIVDKNYLDDPDRIEFEAGSIEALKLTRKMGLKIVVISNQSGVARGLFGIDTVERVNARLLDKLAAAGVEADGLYYCPHLPGGSVPEFSGVCNCRKPAPGMAEEAARQLGVRLQGSYVVGDKLDDLNLGQVIGARSFLVRTGHGRDEELRLRESCIGSSDCVTDNLLAAVKRIRAVERND
ncbi:MAG: HAD-IIIA family hydrolase [candidate division Zixibacteria bacterium]|nr:HAD-IIIA family hydrolase [candidate division Zixibacteria bacterium]